MFGGECPIMVWMARITFLITDLHRGGSPLLLRTSAGLAGLGWEVEVVSIAPRGRWRRFWRGAGWR